MQTLIVILIVAIAAAFLIRKFLKNFKQEETCNCGCSSCPADPTSCEENPDKSQVR
jgi:type II secretory pathway pseudopilin PulG